MERVRDRRIDRGWEGGASDLAAGLGSSLLWDLDGLVVLALLRLLEPLSPVSRQTTSGPRGGPSRTCHRPF